MPSPRSRSLSSRADGKLRLVPGGDLVASTVEGERERWQKGLDASPKAVILSLKGVRQIDSLGITLILGAFKTCQKQGIPFAIEEACPDLMRVFRLFSLPKLFPVHEGPAHE
nr:STAS domain-containing protein [uncultured Holophaga sp.]